MIVIDTFEGVIAKVQMFKVRVLTATLLLTAVVVMIGRVGQRRAVEMNGG